MGSMVAKTVTLIFPTAIQLPAVGPTRRDSGLPAENPRVSIYRLALSYARTRRFVTGRQQACHSIAITSER